MLRLCIDIDNVLAQTDEVVRRLIRQYSAQRVALEYQDVVRFDYWACQDSQGRCISREEWQDIHQIFSRPENILSIEPYPGVQDALRRLGEKYDLLLATSRLPSARKDTIDWLEQHNFPSHSLCFLNHGQKHVSLGKFDAAIEDDREQAHAFARSGTPTLLLAHPWNLVADSPRVKRVPDWPSVVDELLCQGNE